MQIKIYTSQYSSHIKIHIQAQLQVGLWLSVVVVGTRKQLWKSWLGFVGLGPPLRLRKSFESSLFCQQLTSVGTSWKMQFCTCKITSTVENQIAQGKIFLCYTAQLRRSYKQIQNKPNSTMHFTGITYSKHLTMFLTFIMWNIIPLKGITAAMNTKCLL